MQDSSKLQLIIEFLCHYHYTHSTTQPVMEDVHMSGSLAVLESRLRRLEFHLTGHFGSSTASPASDKDQTARARITRLERNLDELAARSPTIKQLLQLGGFGTDAVAGPY